jgi:hypothetical protein
MTKQVVLVSAVLALLGCNKPQGEPVAERTARQPVRPPRNFNEKLQCATVGERYEKLLCVDTNGGKRNPLCTGWWAYNARRDTCVGVFLTTGFANRKQWQMLNVYDLLTGVELEACYEACHVDSAKSRWILSESEPSPAPPTAAK